MNKKAISIVIEELLLALYLYWVYQKSYFFRLQANSLIRIGLVFGACIIISELLTICFSKKWNADESGEENLRKEILLILFRWALISLVFHCGVSVLNVIGVMKTDIGSALLIGGCSGFCQMGVSYVLDSILGFNRQQFRDMFVEETIYLDKDCPKGYTLKPFDQWHLLVIEERNIGTELNFEYEKIYYIRGEENEGGETEGFFFNIIDDTHAEILVLNKSEQQENCEPTVYSIEKTEEELIVRKDSTWGDEIASFKGKDGRYEYNLKDIDDPIDGGAHNISVHLNDDNDYVFIEFLGLERVFVYDALSCYDNTIFPEEDIDRVKDIERIIMKMWPLTLNDKSELEYEREILTAAFPMLVQMIEDEEVSEENEGDNRL